MLRYAQVFARIRGGVKPALAYFVGPQMFPALDVQCLQTCGMCDDEMQKAQA